MAPHPSVPWHAVGRLLPNNMENGGSDSSMSVLIWGIVLLGSIGVFIVWGLVNAYPGMA